MPSIKQIEAFYWSGQLGSFVAAAERLNTTQSNISKRIQELEYTLGVDLFDRAKRAIRLTAKGDELMRLSDEMLRIHMRLRQVGKSALAVDGPFRFGVTEAVALTWLPRFSQLIQSGFPGLIPISTVDTTVNLNGLLRDRKIDLAIGTERNFDPSLTFVPLIEVHRVWVASPKLIAHDRKLTAEELAALPMLGHGDASVHQNLADRYLRESGITPRIVSSCTSMSALARMVVDGIGITYLHKDVFEDDISAGRIRIVESDVVIPPIRYVAAYRNDVISPISALVAARALEVCHFSRRTVATSG